MATRQQILDWHDELLDIMLEHRMKNPEFTFAPRQKNNSGRLEQGFWFQGNDNYVFGGMTLENDENNKTRQVGFVVGLDREGKTSYNIEIVFKTTRNEALRQVLKDFVIRPKSGFANFDSPNTVFDGFRYGKYYWQALDMKSAFQQFINEDWNPLLQKARDAGVLEDLIMPEREFQKYLDRILSSRNAHSIPRLNLLETNPPEGLNFARPNRSFKGAIIDFQKEQQENEALGHSGENFVREYERTRLEKYPELAKKVEKQLDGKGFDILSFDEEGNEIHIEVKTTRYGLNTPFYISEHEVIFSSQYARSYVLWRLYEMDTVRGSAKYYRLSGNMREVLQLEAIAYRAAPK